MPAIAISSFCRDQAIWKILAPSLQEKLAEVVAAHFGDRRPGYRDGVALVSIPAEGFPLTSAKLLPGEEIHGRFESRTAGEAPRRRLWVVRAPQPAAAVEVVCYRRDVLQETNEASMDADWEIVTILTHESPDDIDAPMPPETLMANHFQISGGTATGMDAVKFEAELKRSFLYWRDRAGIRWS